MSSNNSKWYIVQVVSNYEQKVKDFLENRDFDRGDRGIEEIYIPYKTTRTEKTGKIKKRPMFPSYLYVKLEMTDKAWYIIRNTEYVTGIIGSSGQRTKPTPIPENEILKIKKIEKDEEEILKNIKNTSESNSKEVILDIKFVEGEIVEINQGDFVGHKGKISSISVIKQKVVVDLELFGRITPTEFPISFIKKI